MNGLKRLLGKFLSHKLKAEHQDLPDEIRAHSSGPTVQDDSVFPELTSFRNNIPLDQDAVDKWVAPYYMNIGRDDEEWTRQLEDIEPEISRNLILQLLGEFNWRSRSTGAFFAGIKGFKDFEDIIGTHLLKSEVTYAGKTYALVLASFNTEKATLYLRNYLNYYLLKLDLWFDQREVLEALTYLDKINKTQHASEYTKNWLEFIQNKPYWKKNIDTSRLEKQLDLLKSVRNNSELP